MIYEWDAGKAAGNLKKHGVAFAKAATVFLDPLAGDLSGSGSFGGRAAVHHRWRIDPRKVVLVFHLDRSDRIRIISARKATRKEAYAYRETS